VGAPPLQIRSLIGLPDVTQRKKKRDTSSEANNQTNASDHASVNNDLRSDPMPSTHKSNGHAPESTTRQDIATFEHWAASDDAGGQLVAETAASAAAACANRDAYAEMAPADVKGKRLPPPGAASRPHNVDHKADAKATDKKKGAPDIPPGAEPLPADGASFVEAVHEKVDLIELEVSLLKSEDEKIRQRELAYLRELKYGKSAAFSTDDEAPQIIFDDGASFPNPDSRDPAGD
jgi:hypothetical protein